MAPPQTRSFLVDARQRDIFPICFSAIDWVGLGAHGGFSPDTSTGTHGDSPISSKCHRKVLKRNHNLDWCKQGIDGLNSLAGFDFSDGDGGTIRNASQLSTVQHIAECYSAIPKPPDELTPARAFRELCGSSSVYDTCESLVGSRVPYDPLAISWPPAGSTPVQLQDNLDGIDRQSVVGWRHHILRSDDECQMHACSPDKVTPVCGADFEFESSRLCRVR